MVTRRRRLPPGHGAAGRGGRGGRRRDQLDDLHAVGVRGVGELLDRPHRHVVERVEARVRVVAPPPRSARRPGIARRVVRRRRRRVRDDRLRRPERVAGQPPDGRSIRPVGEPCLGEAERGVPLPGHHDRRDEERLRVGRGGVEDRPRLHHRRRAVHGPDARQLVPPHPVTAAGPAGDAGGVHLDVVRRPQPPVADVGGEQPVVERVEPAVRPARVPQVRSRAPGRSSSAGC